MTRKKRSETPEYQWGQALLDACYDYRWRSKLEPLHQKTSNRILTATCWC